MWDFKFSRRRVWSSELSSGMYCRVKNCRPTFQRYVLPPSSGMSEPRAKGSRLYMSPVDWVGQSGMRDDRLGTGPMAVGWAVQSRRKREIYIAWEWDVGGSTYLWNVGRQLFYTAVHPRRQFWRIYLSLNMPTQSYCTPGCNGIVKIPLRSTYQPQASLKYFVIFLSHSNRDQTGLFDRLAPVPRIR
jgi:hypothetical protein